MNNTIRTVMVIALVAAIGITFAIKSRNGASSPDSTSSLTQLPRLLDLGADKCIPCKMMAPILEELKTELQGQLQVDFIDVWKNPDEAKKYAVNLIPTQIFFDADGKELFRHEGFFSQEDILSKWNELGFQFAQATEPAFARLQPVAQDTRNPNEICYMCEGDIDARSLVTVNTAKGPVRLCGLHCYFIMYSCLTEDKTGFEQKVTVTDADSGTPIPLTEAHFLIGTDTTGRPAIQTFSDPEKAEQSRLASGGNRLAYDALLQNELSHRCGFCDRACYPQDAAEVIVEGGLHTWGCCSHCALGVAARTGKDIEVHEKDRLTGEPIVVKTLNGSIASLEPATAVAWFGQRQKPDGSWGSAGCFHQGFFTTADHLKQWVQQHPLETGRQITIHKALTDKMKLSPEQIQKACKIGECSPK